MKKLVYILLSAAVFALPSRADVTYENKISVDKIVNNFGDLVTMSGAVSCDFTFTNLSDKPVCLYSIVSSCGCTVPAWSKEPFKNGQSTTISVTFKNEDAPGEFDKTLTCHFTNLNKPVILHIKGRVFPKKVSLEERFPQKISETFAVKKQPLQLPNMEQGDAKETEFEIANLSDKPQNVVFTALHPQLTVTLSENPIPARGVAKMKVRVESSRDYWGQVVYNATIKNHGDLKFVGFTKDNFSGMTEKEKALSGKPYFESSTLFLGTLSSRTKPAQSAPPSARGSFTFKNIGGKPLEIHKVDALEDYVRVLSYPKEVPAGGKGTIEVEVIPEAAPESALEPGEYSAVVVLTTSSPSRPLVNLFVSFIVK